MSQNIKIYLNNKGELDKHLNKLFTFFYKSEKRKECFDNNKLRNYSGNFGERRGYIINRETIGCPIGRRAPIHQFKNLIERLAWWARAI